MMVRQQRLDCAGCPSCRSAGRLTSQQRHDHHRIAALRLPRLPRLDAASAGLVDRFGYADRWTDPGRIGWVFGSAKTQPTRTQALDCGGCASCRSAGRLTSRDRRDHHGLAAARLAAAVPLQRWAAL